jgi:hypothetical protein
MGWLISPVIAIAVWLVFYWILIAIFKRLSG